MSQINKDLVLAPLSPRKKIRINNLPCILLLSRKKTTIWRLVLETCSPGGKLPYHNKK